MPRPFLWSFVVCSLSWVPWSRGNAELADLVLADVDTPVPGEVVTHADGAVTVTAGGGDTYETSDSFTYLHEQRTGDFDVQVRVIELSVDDPGGAQQSAKGALHVRTSLEPGSPNVQVNATPVDGANYIETIARPLADGPTHDPPLNAPDYRQYGGGPWPGTFQPTDGSDLIPIYLRIRRTGNLFETMCSQDGVNWLALGEYSMDDEAFPETLYVGLATVAHIGGDEDENLRVRATYRDYRDTPWPPQPPAGGQQPGPYPDTSVTGVNWRLSLPENGIGWNAAKTESGPILWNTGGFDAIARDMLVSIDGEEGPIPFSMMRYGAGALDFGLSPRNRTAAQANLGGYDNPSRSRNPGENSPAAQAWHPSPRYGVLIPTARVNGPVQWNDGAAPFYPLVYQAVDFSSARYFDMDSARMSNGPFYTRMAKLGDTAEHPSPDINPDGFQRAVFDISVAWFPYAGGWKAGYISEPVDDGGVTAFWDRPAAHSAAATAGAFSISADSAEALVTWQDTGFGLGGLAHLRFPDVAAADGMLFLTPNDDSGLIRGLQANGALLPEGDGWAVALRGVAEKVDDPDGYAAPEQSEFSFLFVPYTANNLIGGHIAGATGAKIKAAGEFTITRAAAGTYELSLPGKTSAHGMLILQPVGWRPGSPDIVDDVTFTYEPTAQGTLLIQSRKILAFSSPGHPEDFALQDADFYVAWVDFTTPLSLGAATPPTAVPELSLARAGNVLTLSWPITVTGFTLVSTTTLATGSWQPVPGVANNSVTLTLTEDTPVRFFRLTNEP